MLTIKYFVNFCILAILAIVLASCSDENNPVEPTDMPRAIFISKQLSETTSRVLSADTSIVDANALLIAYQYRPLIRNKQTPPDEVYTHIVAYFALPKSIEYVQFKDHWLRTTNPVIYPQRFIQPLNWNFIQYDFFGPIRWMFKEKNGEEFEFISNFADDLHTVSLNLTDTLRLSKVTELNWTPSQVNDELHLSFFWRASQTDTTVSKFFDGFKVNDNGKYIFSPSELSRIGLYNFGFVEICLNRIFKEVHTYGDDKKAVVLSITEARVIVPISE